MKIKQVIKSIVGLLILFIPLNSLAAVIVSVTPTSDTVLPGSIRSVYSNVQGDANIAVTWSASGGTLLNSTGFTTWTAPNAPGTYTLTATSVVDNTKSAAATFTVVSTAVFKLNNIPLQATIYKNQPLIIQSLVWGNTNTAVTWSNSGGTLRGTGREVVFSASTAGTFTVTATSQADNSKTSTTTIIVTDNAWPGTATANYTMPIDCTATGSGVTYEVTSEAGMDAVPWSTLGAGDTVRIHPGTYHKQILIATSGTDSQPIRICGVPDGSGNLPVLDGANATAKAGSDYGILQGYGGVVIYRHNAPWYGGVSSYPKNIIIEGVKITGYNNSNTFTAVSTGLSTSYVAGVAPVRIQQGANITLRGNEFTDGDNGIFIMCQTPESAMTRNVLIEGNYIHGNGSVGKFLHHQNYLQLLGLVVQGNYYGTPRIGMQGSQLKLRGAQHFIRYNYFEPAARIIDAVEAQEMAPAIFPWLNGLDPADSANMTINDVVGNMEAYQNRFIYGNILHNAGTTVSAWLVHGATDTNSQGYNAGGTLYFYHNTIFDSVPNNVQWRSGVFDLGPYTTVSSYDVFPTLRATNNVIYLDQTVSPGPTIFEWNRYQADRVILDKNWISSAWGTGNTAGGDGTGISNLQDQNGIAWQGGKLATQVSGMFNLVVGTSIPFDANSYVPINTGPLLNASSALTGLATSLPPLMQYSPMSHLMSVRDDIKDIGALGVDRIPPVVNVTNASSPIKSSIASLSGTVSDNIGVTSVTAQRVGSPQPISATIFGNSWSASVTDLVEGSNSITVTAADTSGNTSTATVTIIVDMTPPVINNFTLPAISSKLTVSGITLTATDNIGVTGYLVNESAIPPATANVNLTQLPTSYMASGAGSKNLYAWARDAAGNVSQSLSAQVLIDLTPPTLTINAVPSLTNLTTINLSGTVTDDFAVSSVTVQVGSGPAVPAIMSGTNWSYTAGLTLGPNTATVTAKDSADNTATATTTIYKILAGDVDGDGPVTIKDALKALRFVFGLENPAPEQFIAADVAPLNMATHQPQADGKLDIDDVILILRNAVFLPW